MNRAKLVWAPAFLAGAAAATAAELSAGLLLYSGLGFLRALTVVLTVQMGALAMGLWTAWSPGERPAVEQVRRRWLFCLVAFTAAAAFAGVTRILGGQPTNGPGQGLGLAFLGGLPLFAAGALLGSLGRLSGDGARQGVNVGAGAATGAAAGFLLTGFVFVPTFEPSSTLLICVIALSGGALLHGWVLDQRETRQELESRWTARGLVQVEDRVGGAPAGRRRVLIEAGRVRGSEHVDGSSGPGWEDAVIATVARGEPQVGSVLVYGTGAGTLVRRLSESLLLELAPEGDTGDEVVAQSTAPIVGIEPNPEVRRLAMAHFPPERPGQGDPWAGVQMRDGVPLHAVGSFARRFDLIVVDAAALGPVDSVPPLHPDELVPILECLETGGTVVVGGMAAPTDRTRPGLTAWMREADVLAVSRLAFVAGTQMFLVLSATADASHWNGGATRQVERWGVEPATPVWPIGSNAQSVEP